MHRDPNQGNYGINDVHPNASMTLLDTLSSLPTILPSALPRALRLVATEVSFDQDVKIQVFEMTIRALGSLLSTYQYLDRLSDDPLQQAEELGLDVGDIEVDDPTEQVVGTKAKAGWWGSVKQATFRSTTSDQEHGSGLKRYKSRLLALALDLGERLLPAFATPTGLPYARVNLRHGVEKGESIETCTAGAGSLVLEFAVLSRLTRDRRFEVGHVAIAQGTRY
jgi:mannosidase alpha-like ER degradation enhancer 1